MKTLSHREAVSGSPFGTQSETTVGNNLWAASEGRKANITGRWFGLIMTRYPAHQF